ncbi:MAG: type VI secretion system tip protein VgrG [Pseudomonadota bacterium]
MADSPTISSGSVVKLTVYSNGTQLDESIQIVSVAISKMINKIPMATIVLLDGDMPEQDFPVSNAEHLKPGAEIKINAGYDQNEETLFQGIVVKHGIKISGNNYARLIIECRDKAVGMATGRKNTNYVDSSDGDIIATLIGNCSGLSSDVASTESQHKELVQYYCTDWDFMLSRAEVNGLVIIVEEGKVTVSAPRFSVAPELKVTYGEDLLAFQADIDARTQLASVKGATWDPKTQEVIEEEVGSKVLNEQGNLDAAELAEVVGLESFRLQTSAPVEKSVLKAWADARQLKAGLARIRGHMKFQGSAKAKIGALIELEGVGNRFTGKVYVSEVKHIISEGNWVTEVEFGMSPDWFAEKRDLVVPPASGLAPGIEGLQLGVVMKLDEDPEGQHRIQVSVPVLQAETAGVWARLTSFYASDGLGAFFVPEIGDEVVLGYFNNDPSYPVVLGSLYSTKRKPPYSLSKDNFIKALVTKSNLNLEFDDEKKIITILTPGNNKVVISDEDQSILLQDQNDNKVELSPDGILLDTPKDLTISAQGKVTIDAMGEISMSSQEDVTVEGLNINNTASVGFVAKGATNAELSASGQTTIKGAMVMIN